MTQDHGCFYNKDKHLLSLYFIDDSKKYSDLVMFKDLFRFVVFISNSILQNKNFILFWNKATLVNIFFDNKVESFQLNVCRPTNVFYLAFSFFLWTVIYWELVKLRPLKREHKLPFKIGDFFLWCLDNVILVSEGSY